MVSGDQKTPLETLKIGDIKFMANYTITKRPNKNGVVYYARVRAKEKGVVTFSKSKSFHSKAAATKWSKELVHKVERNLNELDLALIDATLENLIDQYLEKKQVSDKPLGRTAVYTLIQVKKYKIAKMLVSKINSKDIVNFALERKNSLNQALPH